MNTFARALLPALMALAATTSSAEPRALATPASAPASPSSHAPTRSAASQVLLGQGEADKVRDVIVAQIQAMAEKDADRMFETTTPRVRAAVGNPGRFLAMMLGAYPMVYQPASVSFHAPEKKSDGAFQLVEIKDNGDQSWLAIFILEQQPDRTWRISGCAVTESPWLPA